MIATPNFWIKRKDDGGIIKIPNGHVWVENFSSEEECNDSITKFGPVSQSYVHGEALFIVWPFWRWASVSKLEKHNKITGR